MIHHLALRWLVIGLFVLSAAVFGLVVVTKRRPWTSVVSHSLHVVMAVAMVVMAWPWSTQLPTTGPAVFFLLAAVWFVTLAVVEARTTALRALSGYHALMMLATAWMYAIMNGHLLPVRSSSQQPDMSMPGMDMPGMDMAPMNTPVSSGYALMVQRSELDRYGRVRGRGGFLDLQVLHRAAARGDPVQVAG